MEKLTQIQEYILNSIDGSGYSKILNTNREKIQFIKDTFLSEYGHNLKKLGAVNCLKEWLSGLPSSVNIDFENHQILNIGYLLGYIKPGATEHQEDCFLNEWFMIIAKEINKLFTLYIID